MSVPLVERTLALPGRIATRLRALLAAAVPDAAPTLALAMEKGDPDIMSRKPRARNEPIVNSTMRTGIVVQMFAQAGVVLTAFVLGLLWHLRAGEVLPPHSSVDTSVSPPASGTTTGNGVYTNDTSATVTATPAAGSGVNFSTTDLKLTSSASGLAL